MGSAWRFLLSVSPVHGALLCSPAIDRRAAPPNAQRAGKRGRYIRNCWRWQADDAGYSGLLPYSQGGQMKVCIA